MTDYLRRRPGGQNPANTNNAPAQAARPSAAALTRVREIADRTAAQAADNRAKNTEFTAFVEHLRGLFGPVKVKWVRWPDGTEQGKRHGG